MFVEGKNKKSALLAGFMAVEEIIKQQWEQNAWTKQQDIKVINGYRKGKTRKWKSLEKIWKCKGIKWIFKGTHSISKQQLWKSRAQVWRNHQKASINIKW